MSASTKSIFRRYAYVLLAAIAGIWFELVRKTVPEPYLVSRLSSQVTIELTEERRMRFSMSGKQTITFEGTGASGIPR